MRKFFHSPARLLTFVLMVTGLSLVLTGLLLLLPSGTPTVLAQTTDEAEYVGSRECSSCHRGVTRTHGETRHARTLLEARRAKDAILADFEQGADIRTVQFPGEDTPRAFTLDDIELVVGTGRNIQRYLYEVERDQYMVLPAEWNVVEAKWEPLTLASAWPDPAYDWGQNCAGCHTTGLNERGRWKDEGVQCESCHGPGSVHAEAADDAGRSPSEDELIQIRSTIVLSPDPQICGACHSQGTEPEQNRPYPVAYRPGGALEAEGVFTLAENNDPTHWWASGHGKNMNMQYNEWLISGHARALDSLKMSSYRDDSCLSCHSGDERWIEGQRAAVEAGERTGTAPAKATIDNAQYGVTCSSCHSMHAETPADYQLVDEPYALCTNCHGDGDRVQDVHHPVQEMYEGVEVVDNVAGEPSNHYTEGARCVTCHMPTALKTGVTWHSGSHTMAAALPGLVEGDQPDSCTSCHTDLTRAYMQEFIGETQAGVENRLTAVQAAAATRPDTPDWVKKISAFVLGDVSLGVHNYAYTSSLLDAAELEMGVIKAPIVQGVAVRPIENPADCEECHADEYRMWQTSPHANASLNDNFQKEYAAQGRPSFCMSCHASGYDPRTSEYVFEGVICSNCHYVLSGAVHPPGPVEVATDSAVCGSCHEGAHAPTYDEWLVSSHSTAGVDCADCHTPHDNGLLLGDVNATCSSCHAEASADEIHMGEDMTCVDCHMKREIAPNGVQVVRTGHSMGIDPGICASCHGNTHLLSRDGQRVSGEEAAQLTELETEVVRLQDTATQNLNSGIVGGAIGALVLVVIVFLTIRLGRMR